MAMLHRNLHPKIGHVNGTGFFVDPVSNDVLFLRVTTEKHKCERRVQPRVSCDLEDDDLHMSESRKI